jgi:hypothetical protein
MSGSFFPKKDPFLSQRKVLHIGNSKTNTALNRVPFMSGIFFLPARAAFWKSITGQPAFVLTSP